MGGVDVQFVEIILHKSVALKDTFYQSMVSSSMFLAVTLAKYSRPNNHLEIIQDLSTVITRKDFCK
jgi:hypothetical protein